MSTRNTIAYDSDFHLYKECFEYDNVYLRLDSGDWAASLETEVIDWRDGEVSRPTLHLRVDVTMWRKIVEGWLESQWSQTPEDDHKKIEFNLEKTSRWLRASKEKTNEIDKEELP